MNQVLVNIICAIICLLVGYLFGSIPVGVLVGKIFFKQDPRELGSKNSGGTNASRLWGFKYGIIVYILDFLKLAIPLWGLWAILTYVKMFDNLPLIPTTEMILDNNVDNYLITWPVYWLVVAGCILGHCYPLFASFKGGKAASVTFSSAIFSSWFVGICGAAAFFITLKIKKYISLSSIIGSIVVAICSWLTCIPTFNEFCMYGLTLCPGYVFASVMTFAMLILIFRHRSNIIRIKNGNERKISWM